MTSNVFLISCLAGVLVLVVQTRSSGKIINLSPSGKDLSGCGNSINPCRTLRYVLSGRNSSFLSFTELKLQPGDYTMQETYSFTGLQDFTVTGDTGASSSPNVKITCSTNASLAFFNSSNIVLRRISLRRCADWHSSTKIDKKSFPTDFVKFLIAVQMRYCTDVTLKNIEILESPGLAVNLIDIVGTLKIQNCFFGFNFPRDNVTTPVIMNSSKVEFVRAGGGVFLKLTRNGSYDESLPLEEHNTMTSGNQYLVENCQFLGNEAPRAGHEDPLETPDSPFSRGGGLAFFFKGYASNNKIDIHSCTFAQNKADWGGGVIVEFSDETQNNSLFIRNSTFESNVGHFAGGGARIGSHNPVLTKSLTPQNLLVENCSFRNNTSLWGGGLALHGSTRREGPNLLNSTFNNALFKNCHWIQNKGTVGSAIGAYLKNLNRDGIGPSVPFHLLLDQCSIIGNEAIILGDENNIGHGAIYSVRVPMELSGNTLISNNSNSAMAIDSSTVDIRDRVIFSGNRGYRGGAVAMYGSSRFVLHKNSKLIFHENRCEEKGGAVFVAAPGPIYVNFKAIGSNLHHCFFTYAESGVDYENWQTEIVFRGNQAPAVETGMSLYATTLVNCRRVGEKRDKNSALEWRIIKYIDNSGNESTVQREVSTDPIDIKINSTDWNVAPGQRFNASADLTDEKNNIVFGVVNVKVNSSEGSVVKLGTPSSLFLSSEGQGLTNIWLNGGIDTRYNVTMATFSGPLVSREINNVSLKRCNNGYRWKSSQCVCNSDIDDGVAYCSRSSTKVFLRRGFWGGVVDGKFVTHPCPEGYCKCPEESPLGDECLFKPGGMCIDSRDGDSILCGSCKEGYTAVIGSAICVPSCNNWLLFAKIPGFSLLLTVLIIAVMGFNIDAFTSYLNAALYSYQVMSLLKADTMHFDPFITFLTGIVDLQIKVGPSSSMCFASGMNEADKLMAMYLVPTYALLFVAGLSYVVRNYPEVVFRGSWRTCCKRCWERLCSCFGLRGDENQQNERKWFKEPIHTICTIILFCYTAITGISLKLLNFSNVGGRRVLFLDGDLAYFGDWKHILYGVWAILMLLLIAIFTLFLMLTPYFKEFKVVRKLKPFFNVFQGYFKDNYRWFSAFYFVCRLVLILLAIFAPRGPAKRCLLDTACILFLGVFLYFKPYNEIAKDGTEEGCCVDVQNTENNSSKHLCHMKLCCLEANSEENESQNSDDERKESQNKDEVSTKTNICKKRCKIHGKDHDFGWVNTTDALLLVNLCLIAVISSQNTFNVSHQARQAMSAVVNVLAYVPLVVLFYAITRALSKHYWNKVQKPNGADVELRL